MAKKKVEVPKVITEAEYFSFEAHDWKRQEFEHKRDVARLRRELIGKDLAILKYRSEDMVREQKQLYKDMQSHETAALNVDIDKNKIKEAIAERLGLEGNWGINPDTLEIID